MNIKPNFTVKNFIRFSNIDVSIVMTTHNRKKQTLFTLDTINKQNVKNLEVIIVDDFLENLFSDEFLKFKFNIKYIKIINKNWINSCVNYNIGFKFIDKNSSVIIIQNAEVSHFGNVITKMLSLINDNNYVYCDVIKINNENENNIIYQDINNINDFLYSNFWYTDSYKPNHTYYHFLTCITAKNLSKLGGFDNAYAFGKDFDDADLVLRIQNVLKLDFVNIDRNSEKKIGIHLWHPECFSKNCKSNIELYLSRVNLYT